MSAVLRLLKRERDDESLLASFILGRPASTQRIYQGEIRTFLRWSGKGVQAVGANDLRGYIESCRRNKLAPATIHRKTVIVKAFFAFLRREDELPMDPMERVDVPPCPTDGRPRSLTPEHTKGLFQQTAGHSIASIRDRALFLLMAATGLRISEACALSAGDVSDADEKDWKALRVLGKGSKVRTVHVAPEVWAVVMSYLARRKEAFEETTPLFAATPRACPIGAMAKDGRLSDSSVYERFKRLAKKAGIPPECSPHSLRHWFACEADASGASMEAIRLALGHAGLGTTQKYLNRVRRGINEAFAKVKVPS